MGLKLTDFLAPFFLASQSAAEARKAKAPTAVTKSSASCPYSILTTGWITGLIFLFLLNKQVKEQREGGGCKSSPLMVIVILGFISSSNFFSSRFKVNRCSCDKAPCSASRISLLFADILSRNSSKVGSSALVPAASPPA
jgi:hypothetical protein